MCLVKSEYFWIEIPALIYLVAVENVREYRHVIISIIMMHHWALTDLDNAFK